MIVTAQQMRQIEQQAAQFGLSMERLMENAGSAAAATARYTFDLEGRFVTLFCGAGNNGGDGLVMARRLHTAGVNTAVVLTDGAPKSPQAQTMFERITLMDIPILEYGEDRDYLAQRLAESDLLVDAIYGIGFHGELDDHHRDICRLMNGVGVPVVALDMPSGMCADSGKADPCTIRAALTVVFDSEKPAVRMPTAATYCGNIACVDIGIPPEAREGLAEPCTIVDRTFVFEQLAVRPRDSHKGDYGRLLNIAGSQQYMGAALLSTSAALRTGAGYVTLASTKEVCRAVLPSAPEAVMLPLRQTPTGSISREALPQLLEALHASSAILMGNGLGTGEDAHVLLQAVLEQATCPVILDADGINLLAQHIHVLEQAHGPLVLTPHLGELSRLTGLPIAQLGEDAFSAGQQFAMRYGVTVVVKGAHTVTATQDAHSWINTTGNAGLAKAGTGDVLAGIIGALAAQGHPPEIAAACGVWLHGAAGDRAAQVHGQYGMLAHDLVEELAHLWAENGR